MKNILVLLIALIGLTACKTLNIQKKEINQVQLLNIGKTKSTLTRVTFSTTTQAIIKQKIKVEFSIKNLKATKIKQLKKQDSTFSKTTYVKLKLADKVTLIQELNKEENKGIIDLLKIDAKQKIITQLELILNKQQERLFKEPTAVYLVQNKDKQNTLEVHSKIGVQETILGQSRILNYQTEQFCWAENDEHQIQIVSLGKKCNRFSTKTYQKAVKKKERNNPFRF